MPTVAIPQALKLAIRHHEVGRLVDAETIYRQILAVQPNLWEDRGRAGA
jgi:hypothetical protein